MNKKFTSIYYWVRSSQKPEVRLPIEYDFV